MGTTCTSPPAKKLLPPSRNVLTEEPCPRWSTTWSADKVLFLMALAVYRDSDAVSEMGVVVRERLLEYIHHLLIDGHEPDACGRLAWSHCPVVHALALIRHTDAVWKEMLTDSEREKTTVIMKAMVAAANYCHEDDNNFIGTVSLTGDHRKSWNPNHQEPYVAALIAGSLFFGGRSRPHFRRFSIRRFHGRLSSPWAAQYADYMGGQHRCEYGMRRQRENHSGSRKWFGREFTLQLLWHAASRLRHGCVYKSARADRFGIYNNLARIGRPRGKWRMRSFLDQIDRPNTRSGRLPRNPTWNISACCTNTERRRALARGVVRLTSSTVGKTI